METPDTPAAELVAEDPTPEPVTEVERTDPPEANLVGEAKRKQRQAEKEAKDLRERLEALEDRDKSETERERKARERAEVERDELASRVQRLERGGWVRSAAAEAGFNDAEDAVAFADLADIESEAEAKRAVKSIASRKPHLLKPSDPTPPQIGKVLENGQPTSPSQPGVQGNDKDIEAAKSFAAELQKLSGGWVNT